MRTTSINDLNFVLGLYTLRQHVVKPFIYYIIMHLIFELVPLLLPPFEMDVSSRDGLKHKKDEHESPDDTQIAVKGIGQYHGAQNHLEVGRKDVQDSPASAHLVNEKA